MSRKPPIMVMSTMIAHRLWGDNGGITIIASAIHAPNTNAQKLIGGHVLFCAYLTKIYHLQPPKADKKSGLFMKNELRRII